MSVKSKRIETLSQKAKSLPLSPGCYLMKDKRGQVLYVGKAQALKKRVTSYFTQSSSLSAKTKILVSHIHDFDFIGTETDAEAFVLENNLIKKHSPKYNINLRDDKSYPYVAVNMKEKFPRPEYKRRPKRGPQMKVFGPFVHGSKISSVLKVLIKSFSLRDCSLREFRSRKRPCLLYQMHQCSAPCVDYTDNEDYHQRLEMALDFFQNKGKKSLEYLQKRMEEASEGELFELAASLRDQIALLRDFVDSSEQKNVELSGHFKDVDIIGSYEGDHEIELSFYMVREGILLGHRNFSFFKDLGSEDPEENLLSFIFQYYQTHLTDSPGYIVLDIDKEKAATFQESLNLLFHPSTPPQIKTKTNKFASLLKLTQNHAKETQRVRLEQQGPLWAGLDHLKKLLKLKERPRILECFDVAIWQGRSPTASKVRFIDGKPDKKGYRYYHLQVRDEGNNDFAMMQEVLQRRIESEELPDLFVIDGGTPQVRAVEKILKENQCEVPVVGIAKSKVLKGARYEREVKSSDERLIIPGRSNPYILAKDPALFRLIVKMRDEAHRFSRKLHHKSEKKHFFHSWPDLVNGIGPKTKERILKNLTMGPEELGKLSAQEISKKLEVKVSLAQAIKSTLHEHFSDEAD